MGIPTSPSWQTIKCVSCVAYIAAGVWKESFCHNIGANTEADPFTPSWELNGDYYQWGFITKAADGPAGESTPNASAPATWNTTPAADGSWTDEPSQKGPQDPCPMGFRIPSKSQWDGVVNNNTVSDPASATWTAGDNNYSSGKLFGSSLFLPAAGSRVFSDGSLFGRDSFGNYRSSSTVASTSDWYLLFSSAGAASSAGSRTSGFSLRCIAE